MSDHDAGERPRLRSRLAALPRALDRAPTWLVLAAGVLLLALGLGIVGRPLTSLTLLGMYVGASCVITGMVELVTRRRELRGWDVAFAIVWIVAGVVVLGWLGRSLEFLPEFLAVLLMASGVGRFAGIIHGRLSSRVLNGALGISEIAFGALALLWPDVTFIVVAVLFGIRTIVFAISLLGRGMSDLLLRQVAPPAPEIGRRPRKSADALRWVAAVVILALAGGSWVVSDALHSGVFVLDSFYAAPATVPHTPGALLRSSTWPGTAPAGSTVTRILYTTTGLNDRPAIASAIVVVPISSTRTPRTVVAWDHGTTGVARACAPSLMNDMFQIQGIPAVDTAIAHGWAIVATDYTGQGAAGDFPYLIGESEGRSTLDAVRAAQQLDGANLSRNTVIWGHSQGGHAALWTAKIAPTYAPELTVLGVAALSPAADPWALANSIQQKGVNGPLGVIAAWVLVPYSITYPDVRLSDYVAPAGQGLVHEYATRCVKDSSLLISVLSSMALSNDQPLYVSDLVGGAAGRRLHDNAAVGPFDMPVFVAWGSADEVIPASLQRSYVRSLCASGQALEYHEYPGYTHMSVLDEGSGLPAALVAWTQDRIAGTATVNSCSG